MLVFSKENLVILAVPKTGTTALHQGLEHRASAILRDPPGVKHMPVHRYRKFLEPVLRNGTATPEVLAVVRNPLDWLGSWYRYRSRDSIAGTSNSTINISFDDFVTEYMADKPRPFARVGSQSNYVLDSNNKQNIDHVFAYEDQNGLRAFLEARLAMAISLPERNVSPHMTLHLSSDIRAAFENTCAREFIAWDLANAD